MEKSAAERFPSVSGNFCLPNLKGLFLFSLKGAWGLCSFKQHDAKQQKAAQILSPEMVA